MTFATKLTRIGLCALLLGAAAPAMAADTLEIRDFIGVVTWSNGPMNVEMTENAGKTKVTTSEGLRIDGGIKKIKGRDCEGTYGRYDISWFGKRKKGALGGYKGLEDYPKLDITLPADTKLVMRNTVIFTEGAPDLGEADITLRYCGNVTLGDITNTLALDHRGSADISVGRTGQIAASLRGSGDLEGGDSGDVLIDSRGSGGAELGSVNSLEANLYGSGDLEIGDIAQAASVESRGSGDIDLGRVNGTVEASSRGSGDLEIDSVEGNRLSVSLSGSGDAEIDSGEVSELTLETRGSGSIAFDGVAETATLRARGSGDISVGRVRGEVDLSATGSGEIDVGSRD